MFVSFVWGAVQEAYPSWGLLLAYANYSHLPRPFRNSTVEVQRSHGEMPFGRRASFAKRLDQEIAWEDHTSVQGSISIRSSVSLDCKVGLNPSGPFSGYLKGQGN